MEIILPHKTGYDFGIGIDRLSGYANNKVVEGEPTTVWKSEGIVQSFNVTRVRSSNDLQQQLGLDIEASYGCASFGAGASARFKYMKETKVQSTSLFMTVTVTVHLADLSIDESHLTVEAGKVVDKPDVFAARYGNMFARACKRGGLFVGVLHVQTNSEQEASSIEGELRGSYGLFSAEAKANFQNIINKHNASVYCSVYAEGGPAIQITKPDDPAELLTNANSWIQAFQENPDKYSRPYEWTFSDISIAEGPLPLNYVQIQKVQDILKFCARERTTLLDSLNQFTWILNHPEQFDWTNAVSVEEIQEAARTTQVDLDTIADCASDAINDPENAQMPAPYAQARNKLYPFAVKPSPLPQPRPGVMVEVPNTIGLSTDVAVEKVKEKGLNPILQVIIKDIASNSNIVKQEPEPFKEVPRGSNVDLFYEDTGSVDYGGCSGCTQ
ncbi:PASTA domain-containing protein [Peribacillus butanolivorans]|uniref:PASTA domain-containing protein n=1 Tax=Peribacillus butanolivorans TaxID=421767 RepID=UPI0036370BEA